MAANIRNAVLCDSSALISLTDACFIDILYFVSKTFNVDFVIPPSVKKEIIDRPLGIQMKAYQLSALRMKKAIHDEILTEVNAETEKSTIELLELANTAFYAKGKPIHLIEAGEADMLALAHSLEVRTLLMDERTTRMLVEAPFRLKEHLEREINVSVMVNKDALGRFSDYTKNMSVIRSSEMVSVAYKKGYFSQYENPKQVFEAALYSVKYGGCALSFEEINQILKLMPDEAKPSK